MTLPHLPQDSVDFGRRQGPLHVISRLRYIFLVSNFELLELGIGFFSLSWGLWLLLIPGDSYLSSAVLRRLLEYMTETAWGLTATAIGVARLIGLIYEVKQLRVWANLFSMIYWGTVWWSLIIFSPLVVSNTTYAFILCIMIVLHVRLGGRRMRDGP